MYRLVTSLQLGVTGITDLRAQLLDSTGANSGGVISSGFTADLGGGQYLWDYSSFPDGFYGAVAFYRASAPNTRWIHAINPQEGENLDDKISSRMATFTYTAPDNTGIASILNGVNSLVSAVGTAGAGLTALPGMVWAYIERTLTAFGMAGGIEYTYTLTSSGGGVIADALLWFATDAAITNTVWFGSTDAFGVARDANGNKPRLAPGTYYIRAQKSGYMFDVDIETVS